MPVGDEEQVFKAAFRQGLSVVLKGPTGCGKTRFVEAMAHDLGRPLITVSCHDDLTTADLVGRFLLEGGETALGRRTAHARRARGAICYLDEVVEARQDTTVVLHPLADHRRQLPIDRLGVVLDAAPEFCLVVSYNPGYQSVLKDLKDSTRQRMVAIELDFPPPDVEEKIVAPRGRRRPRHGRAARAARPGDPPARDRRAARGRVDARAHRRRAPFRRRPPACARRRAPAIAGPLTDDPVVGAGLREMIATYLADPTDRDGAA